MFAMCEQCTVIRFVSRLGCGVEIFCLGPKPDRKRLLLTTQALFGVYDSSFCNR